MPFDEFKFLCSETVTDRFKNVLVFNKFPVCCFRVVSTSNICFFSYFTDFGVPIRASICFSMTNGDSDVIGFSLFVDSVIRYLAVFLCCENC